jgi:PKD repeat protein
MIRRAIAAVWGGVVIVCGVAAPAGATPATPEVSVHQQGALTMVLNATTGTHWSWTITDGSGRTIATTADNPAVVTFPASGDYTAAVDATDDDPLAPEPAHGQQTFHVYTTPVASFTYGPASGGTIQLSDTSTSEPTAWSWSLPGGTFDGQVPPPQALPVGTTTVGLTVTNLAGFSSVSLPVVVNGPPQAVLSILSNPAALDAPVMLDAGRSTDPNDDALTYAWDLDGDGQYDDGAGALQTVTFWTPGRHLVGVQVSDGHGGTSVAKGIVTVLADDRPPVALFVNEPVEPVTGTTVLFTATAVDSDGVVTRIEWDLDGDGLFDEAAGPTATWRFDKPGPHRVALRVVDDRGVATVVFRTITVSSPVLSAPPTPPTPPKATPPADPVAPVPVAAAAPSPAPAPAGAPAPAASHPPLITPFPVVRIRGTFARGAVRISLLKVQAPAGATVRVRCRRGSCAARHADVRLKAARAGIRVHSLERQLTAGTVIEVFVTAPGQIGKYTRFSLRRGASPARTDLCLPPGGTSATQCPTT